MNPLGPIYTIDFVVLVACAVVYYKVANMEDVPPWYWAGPSVLVYLLTWRWLGWGIFGCLLGQVVLLAVITGIRILRDQSTEKGSRKRRRIRASSRKLH